MSLTVLRDPQKEENSIASEHSRKTGSFNMRNAKYPCVCRKTKLPGRGVLKEKVTEVGKGGVREEVVADGCTL